MMVDSQRALTRLLALALTLIAGNARSAEKIESLDEDFLSYLADFEGDDDDWTIVEPITASTAKPAKPVEPSKRPVKQAPAPPKPATPDDGSKR
jgi:hypothetical protein